jgi:hypothetical protein
MKQKEHFEKRRTDDLEKMRKIGEWLCNAGVEDTFSDELIKTRVRAL